MEIDTTPKGDYLNPIDKDLVDAFEQGKNYMKEYIQSNPSEFGLVKKEDYDHEKEQHAVWADAATNAMDTVEQLQHQAEQLAEALRELLRVKAWKDKHGKDEYYHKIQPVAWEKAKTALTNYEQGKGNDAANKENQWRLLSEIRPEHKQRVIIFCYRGKELTKPFVSVAIYCAGDDFNEEGWIHQMRGFVDITHWRPLPAPPVYYENNKK